LKIVKNEYEYLMRIILKNIILFSLLFIFFKNLNSQKRDAPSPIQRVQRHLAILGADSLYGRGTGQIGIIKAADYIKKQLKKINGLTFPNNGNALQSVYLHGSRALKESQLNLIVGDEIVTLALNEDYLLDKTGPQTYLPDQKEMVFVGYGIMAPEYDYNDYREINVEGKVVVFFMGEPQSSDPLWFNGKANTVYAGLEAKQRTAISRGAIGSIAIPCPTRYCAANWEEMKAAYAGENVSLAYQATSHFSIIIQYEQAQLLFQNAEMTFGALVQKLLKKRMYSFPLQVQLAFRGKFKEREFINHNIAAVIPGKNLELKDEYLLLSAHYDHLGVNLEVKGDSIYNGVMDNAIGTSVLLELCRQIALGKSHKRSVIILFTAAEEKGLLGAKYYVDHPLIPLGKTIANVNIDGIAVFDEFNSVVGVGAELSTLGLTLKKTVEKMGMKLEDIPDQFLSYESFTRSDQQAFALAGIPSILVMDGLDYQNISRDRGMKRWQDWSENYYHTPFDDLHQPIHYQAVERHMDVLYRFILNILNQTDIPQWYRTSPYYIHFLQRKAERS
jgi:hypothetical protein